MEVARTPFESLCLQGIQRCLQMLMEKLEEIQHFEKKRVARSFCTPTWLHHNAQVSILMLSCASMAPTSPHLVPQCCHLAATSSPKTPLGLHLGPPGLIF